jgi:pimeloyl-ACP methyl ester carboxylesterase
MWEAFVQTIMQSSSSNSSLGKQAAMEIPMPHAVLDVPTHDRSLIRVRFHGNRNGPRLFILHGNSYASDAYFPFWQNFTNSFEVVLFDLRNHGHNPQSDASEHTFRNMVRDFELVVRAADEKFGKKTRTGVFHSGAGLIATVNALEFGTHWDALVLVDAPNIPQPHHPIFAQVTGFENKLVQFALNRRFRFNHPDELADELRGLRANAKWVSGSHELMARSTLRKDDSSSEYLLVCPPELEASLYHQAYSARAWPKAEEIRGPVLLIGADPDVKNGLSMGLANRVLSMEGGFAYTTLPGAGHMLQLEQPAAAAKLVFEFFDQLGIR